MRYGSVCSGIEAATVAWKPLGWESAFFSEIEKFPRAVLQHHYPDVPLHGDFTTIKGDEYGAVDLLCGGTPCQSFSIAGLRGGLADERGNLSLEFIRLASRLKPRWVVWENVPGVLSSFADSDPPGDLEEGEEWEADEESAFGCFLAGLAECGYGVAYRVLDAQYFGVPQRRRRVIVVGYLGDWRPPASVLFERESLCRDITPSRKTREEIAGTLGARTCRSVDAQDADAGHIIPSTFTKQAIGEYKECGVASTVSARDYKDATDLVSISLGHTKSNGSGINDKGLAYTLEATNTVGQDVAFRKALRRLTPLECERLQGFPDNYTNIPGAKDGPRYKAIGNSWAVPKFAWVGQRIQMVDDLMKGAVL